MWQSSLNPREIDLGLDRLQQVLANQYRPLPTCPVITVAGTNGKGSCVAMLEAILGAAGYRVAAYTSPHLLCYNERIRINRQPVDDVTIVDAFAAVDAARGETKLTYFEFGTLAAMAVFAQQQPDVVILEVGLGGRLDAVNVYAPSVALISNVALDHQDWLGDTREAIGAEKAGIFRAGIPAVYGEADVPASVRQAAIRSGTVLSVAGEAYHYTVSGDTWRWCAAHTHRCQDELPLPAIAGRCQVQNAAAVLAVLDALSEQLPVERQALVTGLRDVQIAGRLQVVATQPEVLLDVAHNPAAVAVLADHLAANPVPGRHLAVVGMLADKQAQDALSGLVKLVDAWFVCGLDQPRGDDGSRVHDALEAMGGMEIERHADAGDAVNAALQAAKPPDRVVVFGSFQTVAAALQTLEHLL